MAKHPFCCVAFLVLCAAPAVAAESSPSGMDIKSTRITIAMSEACPANDAMATARQDASRIWSRGDVELRWVPPSKLPFSAPRSDWLLVQCSALPPGALAEGADRLRAIATIRFVDDRPMNVITLSLQNANLLLDSDAREGRLQNHQFPAMRRVRLGRMLGRALAHEIGHFLSQSGSHAESGLMKATHTVASLTGVSLHPFRINDEFPKLLAARRLPRDPLHGSPEAVPQLQ